MAHRLPSTALCIIWFASTIKVRVFNLFGSMSAWSTIACISGINEPISFDSLAQPNPSPAIPRVNTSAEDIDFDLCNEFEFDPFCWFCLFVCSKANFTLGAVLEKEGKKLKWRRKHIDLLHCDLGNMIWLQFWVMHVSTLLFYAKKFEYWWFY